MKISKVYEVLTASRALIITFVILFFIAVLAKSYCYTFDAEFSVPGSDFDRMRENEVGRERELREAAERCQSGNDKDGDREKAYEYARDYGA